MWDLADSDGSGRLDASELWDVIRGLNPRLSAKSTAKLQAKIMSEADSKHDGVLEQDEFLSWWGKQPLATLKSIAGGRFVTKQELASHLNLPTEEATALFHETEEDVHEQDEFIRGQIARKGDLEHSVATMTMMLRSIDERLQRLEKRAL